MRDSGARTEQLSIELARAPTSARSARDVVAERVGDHPRSDQLLLCVSEIVTNAIIHTRSAPTMTLAVAPDRVRVEVADDDPSQPVPRPADSLAPAGRGLRLVDELSTAWGVFRRDHGKVVWFEFEGPSARS